MAFAKAKVVHPFPETDDAKKRLAHRMFLWWDQISADPELPGSAHQVAGVLRRKFHHNGESGQIDQRYIAGKIGLTVRSVQRGLYSLEAREHLDIIDTPRPGKAISGRAKKYRAKVRDAEATQPMTCDPPPRDVRAGRRQIDASGRGGCL
jgi:hypothetical protein